MSLSEQDSVRHFTASSYIVDNEKVLLVNHNKLKLWLPAGGHIEANETPDQAAIREAKEETGLNVEIIRLDKRNTLSYPRTEVLQMPYVITLQNIGDHHHIDMQYICRIKGSKNLNGSEECKWFTVTEVKELENCPPEIKEFAEDAIRIVKNLKQ